MTMPGRSCVALTLLIFFCGPSRVGADCSLERLRISEIQAGQEHGLIQNDSRHAGRKNVSNVNQQYKCSRFPRSIGLPLSVSFAGLLCRREPPKKEMFLFSKALALRGHRHSAIMNMNQTPSAVLLLIELSFPAVSCERRTIFSELGSEIPIKLGLGSVAVQVNGNVMNA